MDYFGKPGGGTPSAPIPITFPNDLGAPPGTQVELWFYDEAPDGSRPNQMAKYGTGTVSADGSQIVPDIDPATGKPYGQPRFCCGYVMPAWLRATLDFINNLLKGAATSPAKVLGGEPVDLATGQFVLEKTDIVLPGRLPVGVTRTYHSGGTAQGPFGRGTSHSYDVSLLTQSDQRTLFLPGGQRVLFRKQTDGTFRNLTDPAYRGVVLTVVGNGHSLRFKDGAVWTFGTPSENLSFLTSQADRNGNTLTFTRTGTLGMLTAITDAAARQLTFAYDGATGSPRSRTRSDASCGTATMEAAAWPESMIRLEVRPSTRMIPTAVCSRSRTRAGSRSSPISTIATGASSNRRRQMEGCGCSRTRRAPE